MNIIDHFLSKEQFTLEKTEVDGVLRTSPLPVDLDRYYDSKNYISHHQDKGGLKECIFKIFQNFNLNYKKNILLSLLPQYGAILDYGCGAGEFLKYIENDFETTGFEPNENARSAAQKKTSKTNIIKNLDEIIDGSCDAITMWHVFEHIENQQQLLNKFYNKLKINGLLIIAVPNFTSYDAKYYKEHWAAYDVPRHLFHYSKNGMLNSFKNSSWQIIDMKPLLLDSYYISILSEKYRKNPLFWLKGPIIGAISNFKASKTGDFSSLIFILRKK